jgi:proteic killer suppression protein
MDVLVSPRLSDLLSEEACKKKRGPQMTKKIFARLDQLKAAPTLADLRGAPGRCHELTGHRKGELAVSLVEPYRLIFVPTANRDEIYDGNCLVWQKVASVEAKEILNYHG